MSRVPKSIVDRFTKSIGKFQKVLRNAHDRDVNESDTVAIVTDILSEVFGYDKYLEVTREFAIRGTYCDLAIKMDDKVQFLIEVKAIGTDLKERHLRQAIDYGSNHGIKWVILTNGLEWQVHRIRFERPITHDLVCTLKFLELNVRSAKDHEALFLISKKGVRKDIREDYYEKVQSVNRFVVGALLLSTPVLVKVRQELRKISEGVKVDLSEVEEILRSEVLKRDVVDGDEAVVAAARVARFYRKVSRTTKKQQLKNTSVSAGAKDDSITESLLEETSLKVGERV